MGIGGKIDLVNGTPYDWHTSMPDKPYHMKAWTFPPILPAGKTTTVYIEWDTKTLTPRDDAGNVTFALAGTQYTFVLQARRFTLQAYLANITTVNNARGTTIPIGFAHDGRVHFVLAGNSVAGFTSSNVPVAWMQSTLATIGPRKLSAVCIPGSHNAGMSVNTGQTAFVTDEQCLCQSLSVYGQLMAGSRYLDVRPVVAGGRFATGHYSMVGKAVGWQGMNGERMKDIIAGVNRFTAEYRELVVINLSHDIDTDTNYKGFNLIQWVALLELLLSLRNLVLLPNPTTVNLSDITLTSLISGRAAVLVLVDQNVPLGDYANHGFYRSSQLAISDNYANTDDATRMIKDQLQKMQARSVGTFFVLSWTLTQVDAKDVLFRPVRVLAESVNPLLFTTVLGSCSSVAYPCVLYQDFVAADLRVAALAMAVNAVFGP